MCTDKSIFEIKRKDHEEAIGIIFKVRDEPKRKALVNFFFDATLETLLSHLKALYYADPSFGSIPPITGMVT
jgi:hypothetical protein